MTGNDAPPRGFPAGLNIRRGLMRGRIKRTILGQEPSTITPIFAEALEAASMKDLRWALKLFIKHPKAKYTYRALRMNLIADKMTEKLHER